ncbi:MAG: BrxA family protein [Planctomycetota bacterium]
MTQTRSNVVSSFTIIKGALIPETYAAFGKWDLEKPTAANLAAMKERNTIGAKSANWLRDVVFVLQRRFDPSERDRTLVELAVGGCDIEIWKPLMLWHMTRDEFLLRDFLLNWLFPRFRDGGSRLRVDDVLPYLAALPAKGADVESAWSMNTSERVAAALLKTATDFGLLKGSMSREFAAFHLPETSFMYLLHAVMDEVQSAAKVVDSPDWRMFLMSPGDVERELLRLHQFRKVHYESAGSLVQLQLPCASAVEFARRLVA